MFPSVLIIGKNLLIMNDFKLHGVLVYCPKKCDKRYPLITDRNIYLDIQKIITNVIEKGEYKK